jgi:hypothetical protein
MKKILILGFLLMLSVMSASGISLKQIFSSDKSTIYNLTVIDSDHNGLNEIYFYESNLATPWPWSLWLYEGDNNYSFISINPPCSSEAWCAGYIDGDSLADMVGRNSGGPITVWESPNYNSYISNLAWSDTSDIADPWDSYISDLDQDGKKEILCRARTDWTTRIYECTGDNQYQLVYKEKPGNYISYHGGMCYGDFDKDGLMEIVSGTGDGSWPEDVSRVFIYENTVIGEDLYALVHTDSVMTYNAYELCNGKDMDGDGWDEIVVGGCNNDGTNLWDALVTIFEATGDNTYEVKWAKIFQTNLSTLLGVNQGDGWDVKTGDIDGDDTCEIAIATSESLIIYKAYGNDNYQRIYQSLTGPGPYSSRLNNAILQVYDVNKNGYDEVIVSGYYFVKPSGSTQYYETRIFEIMGEVAFDGLQATAKDSCIEVKWAASRQFANYGFNLYRATAAAGPYSIIYQTNDTIRLDTTLLNYFYNDSAVVTGTKYYYKIQAKALNDTSLFFGPDSAMGVSGNPEYRITNYEFKLCQNTPNPVSNLTNINYQIAKPGNVSLKIYNTLGQLVNTLADGYKQPGMYSATWNGKDNSGRIAANGVYIYRLESGDFKTVKRMLVIK